MSKASNVAGRYFRASIALRPEQKAPLEERMSALGLNTVGDIVNLFVSADASIVEALKPFATNYVTGRDRIKVVVTKATLVKQLKALDPRRLQELLAIAQEQTPQEAV